MSVCLIKLHDPTFRSNEEAFEIVARVWMAERIELGKSAITLATIGKLFGVGRMRVQALGERARSYVARRRREAVAPGSNHGRRPACVV